MDARCVKPTIIGQIWRGSITMQFGLLEKVQIECHPTWCYVREKLIEWEENGKERISPETSHIDLSRYI